MKKLTVIATSLWISLLAASSAFAEAASLEAISSYLNTLKSAKSDFVQYNEDGSQQTGTLYLKRPGKARFEYNGKNAPLVLISGGQVAVFDPLSNEPPFRFPLSTTPLDAILGRNVDLVNANLNTHRMDSGEFTVLNVQDPAFAQYGYVSLVFDNQPLKLRQWVVVDGAGTKTAIVLSDIQNGVQISGSLFNIRSEMRKRGWTD